MWGSELITAQPLHLSSFLYSSVIPGARVCVCVRVWGWGGGHTHPFPRRQVSKWGGVQTHTEHEQFERVVIHAGVCSQTFRALLVLQSLFVGERKKKRVFVCVRARTSILTSLSPPSPITCYLSVFHSQSSTLTLLASFFFCSLPISAPPDGFRRRETGWSETWTLCVSGASRCGSAKHEAKARISENHPRFLCSDDKSKLLSFEHLCFLSAAVLF